MRLPESLHYDSMRMDDSVSKKLCTKNQGNRLIVFHIVLCKLFNDANNFCNNCTWIF